jgi:serine/threonine protein kinase
VSYAARDIDLERVVALKVVMATGGRVGAAAASQRASQLNHPHIVVHEVGESAGMTYFVMEHVDGETLGAVVSRRPTLDVRYGSQIADARRPRSGVIHRDLKSANVVTDGRARFSILAWRVTPRRVNELSRSKNLSVSESIAGAPRMAQNCFAPSRRTRALTSGHSASCCTGCGPATIQRIDGVRGERGDSP